MHKRTFVIAEAGVNHNGSLDLARQLIDVAAEAGADVVKFQTFRAASLATATAPRAVYQVENMGEGGSQLDMLKRLELSYSDHYVLARHCELRGIRFMSTPFDCEALKFLSKMDMPAVKIGSGDITCAPLLLQASRLRRPLILSTGLSTLADIEQALGVLAFGFTSLADPGCNLDLRDAYCSDAGRLALSEFVTLLHCVTQYPAPPSAANLRSMDTMATAFGLPVGYSDHSLGLEVALAAVARGATVIEKHFTLDRHSSGPDHAASLEPSELKQLILGIRNIEQALGRASKLPSPEEIPNREVARRSLVAARQIRRGAKICPEDLDCKRPGTGISPMQFWDVVGRPALRDFQVDEQIET